MQLVSVLVAVRIVVGVAGRVVVVAYTGQQQGQERELALDCK